MEIANMRGSALLGFLLILAGVLSVPFFGETISRLLLIALLGGGFVVLVVLVAGGVVLVALRGAD
jgi:hypothetical protein